MATEGKAYNKALIKAAELIDKMREKNCNAIEEDILNIFPELKESEGERIRKMLKALVVWSTSYSASGVTKEDAETMLNWLEKQGKYADNVEPKFHESDWVILNENHNSIYQIEK